MTRLFNKQKSGSRARERVQLLENLNTVLQNPNSTVHEIEEAIAHNSHFFKTRTSPRIFDDFSQKTMTCRGQLIKNEDMPRTIDKKRGQLFLKNQINENNGKYLVLC